MFAAACMHSDPRSSPDPPFPSVKTPLQTAILKPWAILGWFGWFSIHQETEANHSTQATSKPSEAKAGA